MNVDKLFDDFYLIKNAAESGDDHHYIEGLYPALERFEEILNRIVYSDCMVNEHIYDVCSLVRNLSEPENTCVNFENQNLNFPTIHPPVSSEELKQAIEYANMLSAEFKRLLENENQTL